MVYSSYRLCMPVGIMRVHNKWLIKKNELHTTFQAHSEVAHKLEVLNLS